MFCYVPNLGLSAKVINSSFLLLFLWLKMFRYKWCSPVDVLKLSMTLFNKDLYFILPIICSKIFATIGIDEGTVVH